jgi:hypothetical protein
VGKTWKDDKVISRHKGIARVMTSDMDLRTRTKPISKKEKGGGKNSTKDIIGSYVDELAADWEDLEKI